MGWVPSAVVLLVLLRSLPAPLGEPVADDFDFIAARLRGEAGFFSGGGSTSFWRPIPHQAYYALLSEHFYATPWLAPALHAALLFILGWLLLRAFRRPLGIWGGACASAFVMASEPFRSLLAWPSHVVELSLLLALVTSLVLVTEGLALPAVLAYVAALACKETAVLMAPMLALFPTRGTTSRMRRQLVLGIILSSAVWSGLYLFVRAKAHLHPPSSITLAPATLAASAIARIIWAAGRSAAVALGLHELVGFSKALIAFAYALLAIAGVIVWSRRGRLAAEPRDPSIVRWGAAWVIVGMAGLIVTFPVWSSYRALIVTVGAAALLISILGGISRWFAILLVAVKVAALVLAPPPPRLVGVLPPAGDEFVDFTRLTRLQLLMRDLRGQLRRAHPTLPAGAIVVQRDFPYAATYALGGSHALQAWYRDTSLVWTPYQAFLADTTPRATALVEFEANARPSVSIVPGEALRWQVRGDARLAASDTAAALACFDQAKNAAASVWTPTFQGSCDMRRAFCLATLGRMREAEVAARAAVRVRLVEGDARFLLAVILADEGRIQEALEQARIILATDPRDARAAQLQDVLMDRRRPH